MLIAVAGGTGTLGSRVVTALRERGHDVRALSRHVPDFPVDLATGTGLPGAVQGCDVVIDASNAIKRDALVGGTERLLAAAENAEVGHVIGISIVGCEKAPMSYYKAKVEQEKVVEGSTTPWTMVRATQFHGLIGGMFAAATRFGVLPLLAAPLQTVDPADVAAAISDVVERSPLQASVSVAGPEIEDARALARRWKAASGSHALPVRIGVPGALGAALRAGALTTDAPDVRGTVTFDAWLAEQRQQKTAR